MGCDFNLNDLPRFENIKCQQIFDFNVPEKITIKDGLVYFDEDCYGELYSLTEEDGNYIIEIKRPKNEFEPLPNRTIIIRKQ